MQYKLCSLATATTNSSAVIKVVKNSRLKGIYFALQATGGAGVGRMVVEVSKQNTSNVLINDVPTTLLGEAHLALGNAVATHENVMMLSDADLSGGDNIYLNVLLIGTAPTATILNVYLICS